MFKRGRLNRGEFLNLLRAKAHLAGLVVPLSRLLDLAGSKLLHEIIIENFAVYRFKIQSDGLSKTFPCQISK